MEEGISMDWPLSLLWDIAQEWKCWVFLIVVILLGVFLARMEKQRAYMIDKEVKDYEDRLGQIGLAGGSVKLPAKASLNGNTAGLFAAVLSPWKLSKDGRKIWDMVITRGTLQCTNS